MTILNSLFAYTHFHPKEDIDLAEALHIPNLAKGVFVVEAPLLFKIQTMR